MRISYSVSNINLDEKLSSQSNNNEQKSANISVGNLSIDKNENNSDIYNRLMREGWLEPSDNIEASTLYNLISSVRKQSMIENILTHDDMTTLGLPIDYEDSLSFQANGDSGLKIHYSVTHKDMGINLFKLDCQFILDKYGRLDETKSHVFFDFFDHCPEVLKEALDKRGIISKLLDWFSNLFNPNGFTAGNTIPSVEKDKQLIDYNIKNNTYLTCGDEFSHPDENYIEDDKFNDTLESPPLDLDEVHREGEAYGYIEGFRDGLNSEYR